MTKMRKEIYAWYADKAYKKGNFMENYREYLSELKSTTLFQDIEDNELIALLEAMAPKILMRKQGAPMPPRTDNSFWMALRATPANEMVPRIFKYDMPKFGEPGMLMAEIPALSVMGQGLEAAGRVDNKKGPGGPPHKAKPIAYDLEVLEFTVESLTKFYSEEIAHAQGIMLRNFLGILAQKVCDVRHELFLIRDARDMFMDKENTLQVFCAGVAMGVAKAAIQKWNLAHPELQAVLSPGGSVDLIRRAIDGERCDVLISADDGIIGSMMMPENAKGYIVFAGNKMVITANPGYEINSENWKEKLLDPKATFLHHNPYGDPGGYRAVMSMLLADTVEPGLAEKLMNHPGHYGMDKNMKRSDLPEIMYSFGYYSGPASKGAAFAELPETMDLSSDALSEEYAKVSFAVDDKNTVTATPICHGLTIPTTAKYPEAAKEFAKMFLETDFSAYGFIEKEQVVVGEDIL